MCYLNITNKFKKLVPCSIWIITICNLLACTSQMSEKISLKKDNSSMPSATDKASVSSVVVKDKDLIIKGSQLDTVTNITVEGVSQNFQIDSKSADEIRASTASSLKLVASKSYKLILSSAAAETVTSLALIALTLDPLGASDGQVLKFNSSTNEWEPSDLDGMYFVDIYAGSSINAGSTISAVTSIKSPILYGSSLASSNLTLDSTSNTTKGNIILAPLGGNVGIGTAVPTQKLSLVGSMSLETTTSSSTGVIYKGSTPFIHNFQHPTGGSAVPVGRNTFVGFNSGNFTMGSIATDPEEASYNTTLGYQTLFSNTTGKGNTAVGYLALTSNTSGFHNTANGIRALESNTTGESNSAYGIWSLHSNTTGYHNVANGVSSLESNTTGFYNTATGSYSLWSNTIGTQNTALGFKALWSNTSGGSNTAIGSDALYSNTIGAYNIAMGFHAGWGDGTTENEKTSVDNYATFIGYRASRDASISNATTLTNITAIGKDARVGADNSIVLGGTGGDAVKVGIGTAFPAAKLDVVAEPTDTTTSAIIVPRAGNFTGTTANGMVRYNTTSNLFEFYQNGAWVNYTLASDGRLKTNVEPITHGLDIVNQLNPVFYDWDKNNPRTQSFKEKHEVGFIAQEVEKILPEVVDQGEDSYRSIQYGKIVSIAVAAVKELYNKFIGYEESLAIQNRRIANMEASKTQADTKIKQLEDENEKLKQENAEIKAYLCGKDPKAPICK